jgi:hypothetical protein
VGSHFTELTAMRMPIARRSSSRFRSDVYATLVACSVSSIMRRSPGYPAITLPNRLSNTSAGDTLRPTKFQSMRPHVASSRRSTVAANGAQLEIGADAQPVRLVEPLLRAETEREARERLGADHLSGLEVVDRLEDDLGPAGVDDVGEDLAGGGAWVGVGRVDLLTGDGWRPTAQIAGQVGGELRGEVGDEVVVQQRHRRPACPLPLGRHHVVGDQFHRSTPLRGARRDPVSRFAQERPDVANSRQELVKESWITPFVQGR